MLKWVIGGVIVLLLIAFIIDMISYKKAWERLNEFIKKG